MTMHDPVAEYALAAFRRRASGVIVPRAKVKTDGWQLLPNVCHHNVREWVTRNPSDVAVPGWLYFDMRQADLIGLPPCQDLLAHAVVRKPDGSLLDITPVHEARPDPGEYPFIAHEGTIDEYYALVEGRSIIKLRLHQSGRLSYFTIQED